MAQDAKFEDGAEKPLRLIAQDQADVDVLSALVQDAVFPAAEMTYKKSARQFAILVNRYRWEHDQGTPERVQSVISVQDVQNVRQQGVSKTDPETVYSILRIKFEPKDDGQGTLVFILAGDGAIACDVEVVNIYLQDVTRPYSAPSKSQPDHGLSEN